MENEGAREERATLGVHASTVVGIEGRHVSIEVSANELDPRFAHAWPEIRGLRETSTRETRVRVRSALTQTGHAPARGVTVDVSTIPSAGPPGRTSQLDLAIAVGVARVDATGEARERLESALFIGELSLAGALRPVRGLIPMLRRFAEVHERIVGTRPVAVIPFASFHEAQAVPGITYYGAATLAEALQWIDNGPEALSSLDSSGCAGTAIDRSADMADVAGLEAAKRALEVAAAGGHNVLLVGPFGAGKTMLARRLPSILPKLTPAEALEVATIQSAAGLGHALESHVCRPFRAPHHTASVVALVGGGDPVSPGEMTLAHGGVLFLDELSEFSRAAIDAIGKAWRAGVSVVHRRDERVSMPAKSLLVGAVMPCPCGWRGHAQRACSCSPERIAAYLERLRPVMDLFEVQLELESGRWRGRCAAVEHERSSAVRERVTAARARPRPDGLETLGRIDRDGIDRLVAACEERKLSAAPVIRLTHTIAALAGRELASLEDVNEALGYRLVGAGEALDAASLRAPAPSVA